MPDVAFGGAATLSGWSAYDPIYSAGITLPTGRAMANGSLGCLIVALYGYVTGRGAARTVSLQLGNSATGAFTVGSAGAAASTGWIGSSSWLVQGGTTTFYIHNGGAATYFGRGGGGTTSDNHSSFAGTLGGGYRYAQAPSAPVIAAADQLATTSIRTNFSGSTDNGGAAISAYVVQLADNPSFTGAKQITTGSGQNVFSDLTPGTTYYYRAAAKNSVTDAAGTVGPWSAVGNAKTLSGGSVSDGTKWNAAQIFASNGTAWAAPTVLVSDGTSWKSAS